MNVLSLFDGISCARLAIEQVGHSIDNYFCSEVDKSCVALSAERFPHNVQLGDVRSIKKKSLPKIDLLIGGSPCQDISNAFKGDGLNGSRSGLFFEFIRLLEALKPEYFVLENVRNSQQNLMDNAIGVKGVVINSSKFSAQFRPRCYWTNIGMNTPEVENEQVIADIIENDVEEHYYLDDRISRATLKHLAKEPESSTSGISKIGEISRKYLKDNERQRRVYSIMGKSPTLLARADTPKILVNGRIRKLTPLECERLQGVPDGYTSGFSRTSRYKMIGNGFTVGVIAHILKNPTTGNNFAMEDQLRLAI